MSNANELVRVMNTTTGQIAAVPRAQYEHPVFGRCLVAVKDEIKPYAAPLYRERTVAEFEEEFPHKLADAEYSDVDGYIETEDN